MKTDNVQINSIKAGVQLLRVSRLSAKARRFLISKGFRKCDPLAINNRHGNNWSRWCAAQPDMADAVAFLKAERAFGVAWWITDAQSFRCLPATDKQWQARICF
jgi:hypothetical protein